MNLTVSVSTGFQPSRTLFTADMLILKLVFNVLKHDRTTRNGYTEWFSFSVEIHVIAIE